MGTNEWALVVSALSLVVAGLAYGKSSKAIAIAEEQHDWAREDRAQADGKRILEAARREWCEIQKERLDENLDSTLPVRKNMAEWARWGDGTYFRLYEGTGGLSIGSLLKPLPPPFLG